MARADVPKFKDFASVATDERTLSDAAAADERKAVGALSDPGDDASERDKPFRENVHFNITNKESFSRTIFIESYEM